MKIKHIRILKAIHLWVSILIFFTFLIISLRTKNIDIFQISSLSRLGISNKGWIWNSGLLLLSLLLYHKIKDSIIDFCGNCKPLILLNKFVIVNLVLTALVTMDYSLHNLTAVLYFLGTSLLIFFFGFKIHKTNFRIGQVSMLVGISSAILPMITIGVLKSLAIPEIEHILLLFFWLFILQHDDLVIDILKKFGF
jgi:hypothetical protein